MIPGTSFNEKARDIAGGGLTVQGTGLCRAKFSATYPRRWVYLWTGRYNIASM